ncbi:MAG: AAA family ATPase [Verrucomicrobiota bacterium]|jgi:dephospho-CoA kinase
MKIIALCGMPGAGKSTFKDVARQLGVPSWYIGQPLVDLCRRAGVEATYVNRMAAGSTSGLFDVSDPLKFLAYSLRQMKAAYPDANAVVFDSVRSLDEVQFLRSGADEVTVIAVVLARTERLQRLVRRDGLPLGQVEQRDRMEIGLCDLFHRGFGVGQIIAMADDYVLTPNRDTQQPSVTFQVESILQNLGIKPHPASCPRATYLRSAPVGTYRTNNERQN